MRRLILAASLLLIASVDARSATADTAGDLRARTEQLLSSYAAGDRTAVLGMVAPDAVMYGSDSAEIFRGRDAIRHMIDDDAELWHGTARIGPLRDLSIVTSGSTASLIFQTDFTVDHGPAVPVRFTMLWQQRRPGGPWLLVQSSNTVPTVHQSAAALLGHLVH